MSDSSTGVLTRVVALVAIIALAAGFYGFSTHSKLAVAEQRVATLEQQQGTMKTQLDSQSKLVVENSSAAKSCQMEVTSLKNRAQTAETALEDMKTKSSKPHKAS